MSTLPEAWQSLSCNKKIIRLFFFKISMNHLLLTRSNQSVIKLELVINSIKSCSSMAWISNKVYQKKNIGLDPRKDLIQMLALWLVVAVGMSFLFKLNLFIVLFISFISRMKFTSRKLTDLTTKSKLLRLQCNWS